MLANIFLDKIARASSQNLPSFIVKSLLYSRFASTQYFRKIHTFPSVESKTFVFDGLGCGLVPISRRDCGYIRESEWCVYLLNCSSNGKKMESISTRRMFFINKVARWTVDTRVVGLIAPISFRTISNYVFILPCLIPLFHVF